VQDRPAVEVAGLDVADCLASFELSKHLSANRTQGVPNMIALVRETAERLADA
jgi:cysteine desulfuration protein SufE